MRIHGLLFGIWLAGCAAPEPGTAGARAGEAGVVASAALPIGNADEATRAALRARINDERVVLTPPVEEAQAAAFDAQAATAALHNATGSDFDTQLEGGRFSAASATHLASFDTVSGELSIADAGSYGHGLAHASDAYFLAHAQALFAALAEDSESALFEVAHLGVTSRQNGVPDSNVQERLGSKVFALRRLGGLRVAGNRLVASYTTDGRLRTARGLWPPIDLAHSQLSSPLSRAAVIDRALEVLLAAGVRSTGSDSIDLETFFELHAGQSGHIAVLRASAVLQTYGAEGEPGRIERHDFAL